MENSQDQVSSPVQHALRSGAIMGAISIILTLLLYVVDYSLLADWKVGIFMILIFLGYVIYAGISYRKEVGGYLGYGKAFQHGFITLALGGIIGVIFGIILYNVIDTELPQKITDAAIENAEAMMERFNTPQDKIDEQLDKMKVDMPNNYTVVGHLKGYLWALLVYAIISSITSLIVRRSPPESI
ncbi:MAG TPA: DUF4199 domain-containing protein [Ohtaekwangia sp.]